MNARAVLAVAAAALLCGACAGAVRSVELRAEERAVLHVGESASLALASDGGFSVGLAGTALVLVKQERRDGLTIYVYRAVETGEQAFVATPSTPGPGGCVSCVTSHYFARVIP